MMAMPHLDDGIVSEIMYRLFSKDAYRLSAVCRQWQSVIFQPTFLCRHLSPRPLPLLDDRPYALIIQPRRGTGFTHLRLVAVDPADRVPVNVPVQQKYMDPNPNPPPRKNLEPAPPLFDVAKDNSVFRADDDLGDEEEDYVVFFEHTVPMLGISVVASHGRLLLCRSRSGYYVCDPAANRWLALPRSTISPSSDASYGLHYHVDPSSGLFVFTVVLLVRRRRHRVLVDTFSSSTGRWDATELTSRGAARCLPATSPGIHVGTCFYWLSRRRRSEGRDLGRHILRYDAAQRRASLLREPPLADNAKSRMGRSLGSVDGRLRMCAFDIRDESESMMPHDDGIEGVHGVWLWDAPSSAWQRVHEATVEDMSVYYVLMVIGEETPVDYAGACSDFVVVDKWNQLLRYDLESGNKVELDSFQQGSYRLDALYRRRGYNAFSFFK